MPSSKKEKVLQEFRRPTSSPKDTQQAQYWQDANRLWWEIHPMRYDWKEAIPADAFSKAFYLEIDRRFFSQSREYLPFKKIPFDSLIPFEALRDKDVLEIGVGNGSHAQLLCQYARSFTGIDITAYAVKSTAARMRHFGLRANILQMDAEAMSFESNSFDFVWSWGVIHHSSDTCRIIKEIHRVLKPGGWATIMVYHRGFWNYYLMGGIFRWVLLGGLLQLQSLHETIQHCTDGVLARYYSIPDWNSLVSDLFQTRMVRIMGSKAALIPLPEGTVKRHASKLLPDRIARFMTNTCRMGSFLVSSIEKRS